ncbi:MAG: tetratricopeptide repeat protein [Acidobacteriota bacterium]
MKNLSLRLVSLLLVFVFVSSPVWATCGGGGGGGGGGMSGNSGNSGNDPKPVVYHVSWRLPKDIAAKPATEGLVLYWFPASKQEVANSSLKESRLLSIYAQQCVSMQLADSSVANADQLIGGSPLPVAVLAKPDGTAVKKLENTSGKLKVADVEKLVGDEVKTRREAVDTNLVDAKAKAAAGDTASATKIYQDVAGEKCMFPKQAATAQKELKRLGGPLGEVIIPAVPVTDPVKSALIEETMRKGLIAENQTKYTVAEQFYSKARVMDPADPAPMRYLGELYRHDIGNWIKARAQFNAILKMPADPLSEAVALHGLGKMTIHDGDFKKGLHLMEQSVEVYPIPLALRNLAVYWNSEGDMAQATAYTKKAMELDPEDPYNVVFAAVYMAMNGDKAGAIKIAEKHIDLLPASYNLAAIYALDGQRDKALSLLKRHFFEFERYEQVRSKEMMEARVDAVFDSIRRDSDFLALTKGADGKLPIPMAKTGMPTSDNN